MKRLFSFGTKWVLTLVVAITIFIGSASAEPWKFGVMSDTQWPNSPDNKNPNVAVNVINHINKEFIKERVKFVIQVGDLTDKPGLTNANPAIVTNLDVRATFAQALYDAGIGFYPLRGNHEDKPGNPGGVLPADYYGSYAREFQRIFPQTGAVPGYAGLNNATPFDAFITTTYYGTPALVTTPTFDVCRNFVSEPTMEGLTYSFDCKNARFVLIDQFTKPAGTAHSNLDATDVTWIGDRFSSRPANTHAFSFAHKGLITENHADNLFNSSKPTASQVSKDLMETFMMHLQNNGVRYHMGGHDHMHNRAVVSSPNTGNYKVQNIIAASNSYKFYIPPYQSLYTTQLDFRNLETPISQEIFTVGYYIFTVDGPKVTVDYYAMPNGCNGDCNMTTDVIPYSDNGISPVIPFTKHETFGYSLNGKEILVAQGGSYALTDDTNKAIANGEAGYLGTEAAILNGTNGSAAKDYNLRPLTKSVNTGWAPKEAGREEKKSKDKRERGRDEGDREKEDNDVIDSDIFTLWGMADSLATKLTPVDSPDPQYTNYEYVVPNTTKTDTYVLSMTYRSGHSEHLGNGGFGIATKDEHGNWVNVVDKNTGGDSVKGFVKGPWNESYKLGTYGVDARNKTAWAVINFDGSFAVANEIEPVPGHRK